MRATLWLFLLLSFALSSCGGSGNGTSSANGLPASGAAISAAVMAAADNCGTEIVTIGFGPGTETPGDDPEQAVPPDFIVNKTWLTTTWGVETYKFGLNESFDTKAQSKNIGIGPYKFFIKQLD